MQCSGLGYITSSKEPISNCLVTSSMKLLDEDQRLYKWHESRPIQMTMWGEAGVEIDCVLNTKEVILVICSRRMLEFKGEIVTTQSHFSSAMRVLEILLHQ